jgi:hypothetical protein
MARGARQSTAGSATGAVGGGPRSAVAQSGLHGVVVQPGGVHGGRPGHFDRLPPAGAGGDALSGQGRRRWVRADAAVSAAVSACGRAHRPVGPEADDAACDAGRAVALGSIAVTVALGWLSMAYVVVVALIEGSLFVLFDLAEGAAMPQLVTDEQVPAAVAQNQAKTQGADLVGQPLGGVLFSIARLLPFLVDAVTYLVSFIALLFIRRPFQEPRTRQRTRLKTEIAKA